MKQKFKRTALKIGTVVFVLVFCVFLLVACSTQKLGDGIFSTSYFIKVWGSNAEENIEKIEQRFLQLDNLLSPAIAGSDIDKINKAGADEPVLVSLDTIYLFKICKQFYTATNGAFNPAIFPIVKLYRFDPENFATENEETTHAVPTQAEIDAVLPYCDFNLFELNEKDKTIVKKDARAILDFGASAKGYAADEVRRMLDANAEFLVNVGGNVLVGAKQQSAAIENPFGEKEYPAIVNLTNLGASTAGTYQRNYTVNNKLYHHIIDKTGYPANLDAANPKVSVSVIAGSSVVADVLSTCGILLPETEFEALLKTYNAAALIIYKDRAQTELNGFAAYYAE